MGGAAAAETGRSFVGAVVGGWRGRLGRVRLLQTILVVRLAILRTGWDSVRGVGGRTDLRRRRCAVLGAGLVLRDRRFRSKIAVWIVGVRLGVGSGRGLFGSGLRNGLSVRSWAHALSAGWRCSGLLLRLRWVAEALLFRWPSIVVILAFALSGV